MKTGQQGGREAGRQAAKFEGGITNQTIIEEPDPDDYRFP